MNISYSLSIEPVYLKNFDNLIIINGTINNNLSYKIINKTNKLIKENKNVIYYIDSLDGDISEGYKIIKNMIINKDKVKFMCFSSKASSIGLDIFILCDYRYANNNSLFYYSHPKYVLEGTLAEIEDNYVSYFKYLRFIDKYINLLVSNKLKMDLLTYEKVKEHIFANSTKQILNSKIADQIVEIREL
jgi:ATP-dependent protease ClpP protease subunit